jgi:cob(I)alamin adenosyltransferase
LKDEGSAAHQMSTENSKVKPITSTKRGDRGQTSLLSGERVSKADLRIEACGNLDESNAAMGLAKSLTQNEKIRSLIEAIQKDLIIVGAELSSTQPGRQSTRIEQDRISLLEKWIEELQTEVPLPRSFVDPGANPVSAALDLARSVVRRTERSVVNMQESGELTRPELLSYLNRLGCLLFTLARYAEKTA